MRKGAYLKENRNPDVCKKSKGTSGESHQSRRVERSHVQKHRKKMRLSIAALFILAVVLSIAIAIVYKRSSLIGTWYVDDVTTYEFYNGREGAMVLPSAEYEFTYSVTDNILYIDFKYEGAKDAQYAFYVDGNSLTLEGGNATTQGIYVLTKRE